MKLVLIILVTFFTGLSSRSQQSHITLIGSAIPGQLRMDREKSASIRIINASSLKRLPAVIKDLSDALKESIFQEGGILGKNGFAVYLNDSTCPNFANSAAIQYDIRDTVFHLKLNTSNKTATDKALAATLIHEIMHCVLLDINKRIKDGAEGSFADIIGFWLNKNILPAFSNSDFFRMMNSGDEGQHELIYQFFYPHMVSLLERFAEIHEEPFSDPMEAKFLMWSGLQNTTAYKKLDEEKRSEIGLTILRAKGFNIEPN